MRVPYKALSIYQNTLPWSSFRTVLPYEASINGLYYSFNSTKEEASVIGNDGNLSGNFRIPEYVVYQGMDYDVVAIDEDAFKDCSGLTSLTIPNSVTSIGDNSFSGCNGLTSMTISKNVTSIGQSPLKGCSGLTSIVVNSGNTVYDSRKDCNAIIETATGRLIQGCNTTVIPDGVTSIENSAFYNCNKLEEITINNSVTSIGSQAFHGCSDLSIVKLNSNSVVSVERTEDNNINSIFGYQVTEFVLGEDVTSIGENAFRNNNNLIKVSVGSNIAKIGDNAFYGCSNLTTLICYSEDIPTANSSVFEGIDLTNSTLYVPASALDDYSTTKPWRRFGTILPIEENITTINMAIKDYADKQDIIIYDLDGRQTKGNQRGLYIIKGQDNNIRKIIVK